jgi:DNA polymerase-3 subunit delta'
MAFPAETAYQYLEQASRSGRLGHAYLIVGPRGSGKKALALKLSALLNESTLRDRGMDITRHPDFHVVAPESRSRRILIEQMRGLEQQLHRHANLGPMKIGVIENADRLQSQAANAFLKTLEEPPENCLLLLLTDTPEALLDTIISRCISVPLQVGDALELGAEEKQVLKLAAQSSRAHSGGVAAAYTMSREFSLLLAEVQEEILQEHKEALGQEKEHYQETTQSAKTFLEQREEQLKALTQSRYIRRRNELVEILVQWWMDVLKLHEDPGARLTFADYREQLAELAGALSFQAVLRRLQALEQLQDNLNFNVQEGLAMEVAFLKAFE